MGDGFYAEGLQRRGLRVVTPSPVQQDEIHRIIYEELIFGETRPNSVEVFRRSLKTFVTEGANSILLGVLNSNCSRESTRQELGSLTAQEITRILRGKHRSVASSSPTTKQICRFDVVSLCPLERIALATS